MLLPTLTTWISARPIHVINGMSVTYTRDLRGREIRHPCIEVCQPAKPDGTAIYVMAVS